MSFLHDFRDEAKAAFGAAWEMIANNFHRWLIALAIALVVFFVLRIVRSIVVHYASRLAAGEKSDWFHDVECVLRRTKSWILLILAACCGSLSLGLERGSLAVVGKIAVAALLVQAALWANALVASAIKRIAERRKESDAAEATTLSALGFVGRLAIWSAAALLIVANLGIDVTAMVAGFGIGGIAVALAAQNILGDLFASASIVLDKPFVLGDFVVIDDKMGSVEYIGLKTTRLRSISGEQLIFSNADLLKSRIHNYKQMRQRRIVFTVDVTYDTPYEKVSAIADMLREAVESQGQERVPFRPRALCPLR